MSKPALVTALLLTSLYVFSPRPALSQEVGQEEAALKVVEGFFDALREKDEGGLRGSLAEDARLMAFRTVDGVPNLSITEFADFVPRVAAMEAVMDERHHDVRVEVRGSLANVWQDYNMFVNGEFSHCGTEVFHLFHFPEGWKILHLSETMTNEGCRVNGG